MAITPLIQSRAELTDGGLPAEPIILSSRIRLARNLDHTPFPGWAAMTRRGEVLSRVFDTLSHLEPFNQGVQLEMADLNELEKLVLVERRLVSRELTEADSGAGVFVSPSQDAAVMVNEEDHLRIQVVRSGFNLLKTWDMIDRIDSSIEQVLDYAFDKDFGYLTACPTNLGTGLRASAMLHLPGLVMLDHMEKVIRMVNQLGMAVRGSFGEGSEASGSVFQISNQQTLGEKEETIIKRLIQILKAVIEQENNARQVLVETRQAKLLDKIGRAYGILRNGHLLSSEEAVNLLSVARLGIDLKVLPEQFRETVDRLMMETQPGHVQYTAHSEVEPDSRDRLRADALRAKFKEIAEPDTSQLTAPSDSTHGTDE